MSDTQALSFGDLVRNATRRWPTIALTAAVAMALMVLAGLLWPKTYTARATVTVAPISTTPYASGQVNQQVSMETERNVASSAGVVALAAKALGTTDTKSIEDSIDVTMPEQSLVLRIAATKSSADEAAKLANAVAKAYLDNRADEAKKSAAAMSAQIQAEIDAMLKTRDKANGYQAGLIDTEVANLRSQQNKLGTVGVGVGSIVTPAVAPEQSNVPKLPVLLLAGLGLGLILGVLIALFRERTDPRLGFADRAQAEFGMPVSTIERDAHPLAVARFVYSVAASKAAANPGQTPSVALVSLLPSDGGQLGREVTAVAMEQSGGTNPVLQVTDLTGQEPSAQAWGARSSQTRVVLVGPNTDRYEIRELMDYLRAVSVSPDLVLFRVASPSRVRASVGHEG